MTTDRETANVENRLIAAVVLVAAGIFVVDLFLPLGVGGGAPYTVLVLAGLWSRRRAFIPILASAATALTVLGAFLSPMNGVVWMGEVNRLITVLAIWGISILLLKYDRTRRALIRSRQDARRYLEVAEILLLALDREGRIRMLNRKGGELLGCDPQEVIGRSWFETFLPQDDREAVWTAFQRLLRGETGLVEYNENRVVTLRGTERLLAWHNAALRDDQGEIVGTVSSGEDVTERRSAEEVERRREALARIGEMAAMVAHEVKNPIAGISGALQILEKRLDLDDASREVFAGIVERLEVLNRMSGDLLQFSRSRLPRPEPIPVRSLVQEAGKLVRSDPRNVGIQVAVEGQDPVLRLDRELMGVVLLNLFLNAAHAMGGAGTIRVSLESRDGFCEIRVLDEGHGIPPEKRDRIFEPFFTTKAQGTGLGLSVARQMIEAHGGSLQAEGAEGGRGACFAIRLPGPVLG
jgi:PAS domain S-box-containing protein